MRADAPAKLELGKDAHLAIIGNALADRMQHDGTLEAFIHKTWPQADIAIRNLGFAADEITSSLDKLQADLDKYLKDLEAQKFDGKGAPRVVLFSPIAQE